MTAEVLQDVWNGILAYDLTAANKRWLAEHLLQQAEEETKEAVKPYTMAELNARIDRAEVSIAAGRTMSDAEATAKINKYMSQYR